MNKTIAAGLLSLTLSLSAAAGAAHAQGAMNMKMGAPSVDWSIADLIANPAAKAVLDKDLPGLTTYSGLDSIKAQTIRQIAANPEAKIDATKLAAIQADLAAVKPAG